MYFISFSTFHRLQSSSIRQSYVDIYQNHGNDLLDLCFGLGLDDRNGGVGRGRGGNLEHILIVPDIGFQWLLDHLCAAIGLHVMSCS